MVLPPRRVGRFLGGTGMSGADAQREQMTDWGKAPTICAPADSEGGHPLYLTKGASTEGG